MPLVGRLVTLDPVMMKKLTIRQCSTVFNKWTSNCSIDAYLEVEGHLSPKGRIAGSPFVLDSVLIHSNGYATLKSASSALVSVSFVHQTSSFRFGFADILSVSSNGSLQNKEKKCVKITFKEQKFNCYNNLL